MLIVTLIPKRILPESREKRQTASQEKDPVDTVLPLLQITKVAMGGTNTATGNRILEYDRFHRNRNPDIVLNATVPTTCTFSP
jgi:hypothetical protein